MKGPTAGSTWVKGESVERRQGRDRRAPVGFPPQFSHFRRRRSKGRRNMDPGGYVDIYDRGSWTIAIAIMALSILDAVLTVSQIERGLVREANPIMNVVLAWGGVYTFFSLKAAMTAFALAIIILHKEWSLARYMVRICLLCYILIIFYHLYLVGGHAGMIAFS
jgi:hypothetical protein